MSLYSEPVINKRRLAFNSLMLPLAENEVILNLLAKGRRSKVNNTKTLWAWAYKEIKRMKQTITSTAACANQILPTL